MAYRIAVWNDGEFAGNLTGRINRKGSGDILEFDSEDDAKAALREWKIVFYDNPEIRLTIDDQTIPEDS